MGTRRNIPNDIPSDGVINANQGVDLSNVPQHLLDRLRLLSASNTGLNFESAYEKMNKNVATAQSYIEQLDRYQKLYKQVLDIRTENFSQLNPEEIEVLVTDIEETRESIPGMANMEPLSRETGELTDQLNNLFEKSQDLIDQATEKLAERRKEVQEIAKEHPGLPEIRREHVYEELQERLAPSQTEQITRLGIEERSNPRAVSAIRSRMQEERATAVEEAQGQFRDIITNQNQDLTVATNANSLRRGMDDETFDTDLSALERTGRVTQRQAERYRSGELDRNQFIDQIGPHLASQYINTRGNPPPGPGAGPPDFGPPSDPEDSDDRDEGRPPPPGDPPPGPDPDDTDPLNVKVVNQPSEPVPVTASGGGPGGGSGGPGPGPDPRPDRSDESRRSDNESFLRQQETNALLTGLLGGAAGAASPGGSGSGGAVLMGGASRLAQSPWVSRQVGGLANAARGAATAAGLSPAIAGALGGGAVALPAAGVAGGKVAWEYAQYADQQEARFGTEQTRNVNPIDAIAGEETAFTSPMAAASISARLDNLMLSGEQIETLADQMAKLGATAEETAEALGPAADALDRYRGLTPEMAARTARRGQQFSPIGAAEVEVLGEATQRMAGQGIGVEAIQGAATTGAQVYEGMGMAGGEYAGMGRVAALGAGGSRSDMLLEPLAQNTGAAAAAFQEDPWANPALAVAYTGDQSYMDLDMDTPEAKNQMEFLSHQIISQRIDASNLIPDPETGLPDTGNQDNWRYVRGTGVMTMLEKFEPGITEQQVIQMVANMEEQGGFEATRDLGLQELQAEEADRVGIEEDATGATQQKARDKAGDAGFGNMGVATGMGTTRLGSIGREARHMVANFTGIDSLRPQDTQNRGLAGNTFGDWQAEEGGVFGAMSTISGIDFGAVQTEGGGNLQDALKDDKRRKALESGKERIDVNGELLTADEVTKQAREGELEFDTGMFGGLLGGSGLQRTGGKESGDEVRVKFTGRAEEFFQVDTSNPNTNTGQTDRAQADDRVSRDGRAPNSSGARGSSQTR